MASRIFIDANVLLDFTLQRESFETSRQLLELAVSGQVEAYISPSIVHITGYWLSKTYGVPKAKKLLLSLLADISVIDISHEVTLIALHSGMKDIEDALQYYAALYHKMDYFISRDKDLAKNGIPSLPVYSPEHFLQQITRKS